MYDEIITLVKLKRVADDYGDNLTEEIHEKDVFAEMRSVTMSEFYQAQAAGFMPEVKFVIADYLDYDGEQMIRYKPMAGETEEYRVVRTYRKGMELEIVCKRGID